MAELSILDLVRVTEATDARGALDNARDLAAHAEDWGYRRFWVAEHHNMAGIASAATSVVIAHIAAGTQRIRVGAGGIMLPNHAPLVIAEQFGTLATLFPGRIDLGLGRAPGTDQVTLRALRRTLAGARQFPAGRARAAGLLRAGAPGQRIEAVPGAGTRRAALDPRVEPLRRAARRRTGPALRLRLAFRSGAARCRRSRSTASASSLRRSSPRPHAMVGVNIIAADTDHEARRLATTQQMSFANIFRGARGLSQPPIDDIETYWTPRKSPRPCRCSHAPLSARRDRPRRHRCTGRRNRRRRADGRVGRLRSRGAAAFLPADRRGRPCSNGAIG